ncbi:Apl1p Ecym_5078 [Eremothecium cymbalariae DBVPG|uniref:AP complex subunit beta n=1 Tax=Eremothecium cymbalariae (strain CBS 270.75 / DBVPG 7215 / KCTC 17166 / NRRL Y-17582) TaxID=931890 RepID=I6NCS6_ERECY|nr:hypothetical protein Ecym_5078 [Eremothecium cymbalariae DBVPG\
MSDQWIFTEYTANELQAEFRSDNSKKLRNVANRKRHALRKIMVNLTMGNYSEMVKLFPEVIECMKVDDDLEVKRICHDYLITLGSAKPEKVSEALPILLRDLNQTTDEQLKIMACRTICSIPLHETVNEAFKYIYDLISKNSPYILLKKTAISALPKLDLFDHCKTMEIVELLYSELQYAQQDPTVLTSILDSLYKIHDQNESMGQLVISYEVCEKMLLMLSKLNEWDKSILLDHLCISYVPESHEEAHKLIEIVVPQLQHANSSVVLNCLKLITYASNYVESIEQELVSKISNSVIALLSKPPELKFLVLRNVILILLSRDRSFLDLEVSYFFIEYNDMIYIKDTKLEILYLLADAENLPQILNELKEYGTDIDIQMSRKAIRAIGNLAVKLESSVKECVNVLIELLGFGVEYIVQEIVSVIKNIMRKYPDDFAYIVPTLTEYIDSIKEPEPKSALVWIISEYSDMLTNFLDLFGEFVYTYKEQHLEVQYTILNCIVVYFVRHPSEESEKLCIHVLKCATEELDNPDLRDRAFIYWRLLTFARQQSKAGLNDETIIEIIDGRLPLIVLNNKLDPYIIEELELNIGTIASVYLKPVSQVFRMSKPKSLPKSPALNQNKNELRIFSGNSDLNSKLFDHKQSFYRQSNDNLVKTMDDYDKPAEKVNQLRKRASTLLLSGTKLGRKLSMKKPF